MYKYDIIETETPEVACKGNTQGNGHPLVYLNMGDESEVICPYCSCKFVLKTGKKHATKSH